MKLTRAWVRRAGWSSLLVVVMAGGCGGQTSSSGSLESDAGAGQGGSAGGTSGGAGRAGGSGSTVGEDGGGTCPSDDSSCPAGCSEMLAFAFDAARQCTSPRSRVVGCTSDAGGTADAPCVKRVRDDALFVASSGSIFLSSPDWVRCSEEEEKMVTASCPLEPCSPGTVSTADGCMSCELLAERVAEEKRNVRVKLSTCRSYLDCGCVPDVTSCGRGCQVAITGSSVTEYSSLLAEIGKAYCSDPNYVGSCGQSAPRCPACNSACISGSCTSIDSKP